MVQHFRQSRAIEADALAGIGKFHVSESQGLADYLRKIAHDIGNHDFAVTATWVAKLQHAADWEDRFSFRRIRTLSQIFNEMSVALRVKETQQGTFREIIRPILKMMLTEDLVELVMHRMEAAMLQPMEKSQVSRARVVVDALFMLLARLRFRARSGMPADSHVRYLTLPQSGGWGLVWNGSDWGRAGWHAGWE